MTTSIPPATGPSRSGRIVALDGLRGLAAAVVVQHHAFLVSPALADMYLDPGSESGTGWQGRLLHLPVLLVWPGPLVPILFFVLSGFVVAFPFLQPDNQRTWRSYYPMRMVRIYLPVAGAVALALILLVAVGRTPAPAHSWWIALHPPTTDVWDVIRCLTLTVDASPLNSVLWSLQWEIWFSLLLPAYVFVAIRAGRWRPLFIVGALGAVVVGEATSTRPLIYLPMFAIGTLLAADRERIGGWASRVPGSVWVVVAAAGWVLLGWEGFHSDSLPVNYAIMTVGATLLVLLFGWYRSAKAVAAVRPVRWLSTVSFSLYLVHEPIIVTVAFLLGPTSVWTAVLVSIPLSLLAAAVFHRWVERPSAQLAKAAGRAGDRVLRRRPPRAHVSPSATA